MSPREEHLFAFTADGFHEAFNGSAKARKTQRHVGGPRCDFGSPTVCNYAFTDVIRAAVSADATNKNAKELVITFLRPTHNIKGHSLLSYASMVISCTCCLARTTRQPGGMRSGRCLRRSTPKTRRPSMLDACAIRSI